MNAWLIHKLFILTLNRYLLSPPPPLPARFYVDGLAEYGDFMYHLSNLMTDNAVLVAQVGDSPMLDDPATEMSVNRYRLKFINSLTTYGFESIVDYEEVSRTSPAAFLMTFHSSSSRYRLFANKGPPWVFDSLAIRRCLPQFSRWQNVVVYEFRLV